MKKKIIVIVAIFVVVLVLLIIYKSTVKKEFNTVLPGEIVEIQGHKEFRGAGWGLVGNICERGGFNILDYAGKEIVIKSSLAVGKFYGITPLNMNEVYVEDKLICKYYSVSTGQLTPGLFAINDSDIIRQPEVQTQLYKANKIYTVDEFVESNVQEGTEVLVRGRLNAKLINAGPDYEGPGGGNYLFGETESILLEPQEALDGVELNQIITVKGKVEYCGGKKVPRYICALSNVEFIQAVFEFKHIELSDHNWEAIGSTITIEKDGSYAVKFGRPGIMETRAGKLTTGEIDELTKIINTVNVFSLNDEYTGPRKTTRSWGQYNLIIETKSGSKSVSFHSEDETVPQALHDIVNTIIELTK